MTMIFKSKSPEEHHAEDTFIAGAKARAQRDLEEVRGMKVDSAEVTERLRQQVERNSWAETVKIALGGKRDA